MFGLVVMEGMTLSGHLSNINEMLDVQVCLNVLHKLGHTRVHTT